MKKEEVRIKYWNYETEEIQMGTFIKETPSYYVVIPDHNLSIQELWRKSDCEIVRLITKV